MLKKISSLAHKEQGATAIEYGLIAGLIAALIVVTVTGIGTGIEGFFEKILNAL